jgi:hypothetical protein
MSGPWDFTHRGTQHTVTVTVNAETSSYNVLIEPHNSYFNHDLFSAGSECVHAEDECDCVLDCDEEYVTAFAHVMAATGRASELASLIRQYPEQMLLIRDALTETAEWFMIATAGVDVSTRVHANA